MDRAAAPLGVVRRGARGDHRRGRGAARVAHHLLVRRADVPRPEREPVERDLRVLLHLPDLALVAAAVSRRAAGRGRGVAAGRRRHDPAHGALLG